MACQVRHKRPDEAKVLADAVLASYWPYSSPDDVELLPCTCDGPARVLTLYEPDALS